MFVPQAGKTVFNQSTFILITRVSFGVWCPRFETEEAENKQEVLVTKTRSSSFCLGWSRGLPPCTKTQVQACVDVLRLHETIFPVWTLRRPACIITAVDGPAWGNLSLEALSRVRLCLNQIIAYVSFESFVCETFRLLSQSWAQVAQAHDAFAALLFGHLFVCLV